MHHHGTKEGGSSDDNYDGDEDETEGVSRALGRESKPKPTRVTRRLTKAHREKKKEERHARQLRGLETLAEEAMKLDVTIDGSTMTTARALTSLNVDASEESSVEDDTRGGAAQKRKYSTDGNESSSDEDESDPKRQCLAYGMVDGRRPGKNELVPLYAMVPAAEYGRTRRRAGRLTAAGVSKNGSGNIDYDSDEIWDGGTSFRPVTVTRIIINDKPVYLAKLTKQISDAAKSRRERERTAVESAGWSLENHLARQKRYEELIDYALPLIDSVDHSRNNELNRLVSDAYYFKQDFRLAIDYMQKYQSNSSLDRLEKYQLGYSYAKLNEYESAIEFLDEILEKEDSLSQYAAYQLGECYLKSNQISFATNTFKYCSSLTFDSFLQEDAYFNYLKLLSQSTSSYNDAINSMKSYLQDYPNSINTDQVRGFLVKAYTTNKDYKSTITFLQSLSSLSLDQEYTMQKASFFDAIELFNNKDYEKSIERFNLSLSFSNNEDLTSLAHYWKSEAYFSLSKYI